MKRLLLAATILAYPFAAVSSIVIQPAKAAAMATDLGDLSSYRTIVADVQTIAAQGDLARAEKRITDFEAKWDAEASTLRARNKQHWRNIDIAADAALDALRVSAPKPSNVNTTLAKLMNELIDPGLVPG